MHVNELLRISTTVSDLAGIADFYAEGLGFAPGEVAVADDPAWVQLLGLPPGTSARTLGMRLGAQELELVAFDPPGRPYPPVRAANDMWFQHIAIVVADMDAAWRRLRRLSPESISEGGPQVLPPNTGGVSAVKFRDPDGHPLELLYFPPGVGDATWHRADPPICLGFDHSAIVVGDIRRSLAFYVDLLGFRQAASSLNRGAEQERLDGLRGDVVDVVGLAPAGAATPHLELLHYRQPAGAALVAGVDAADIAATRQVYRVDDLGGLVDRLRGAGAALVAPALVSLRNGLEAAAVRDPDGHMIVLTN